MARAMHPRMPMARRAAMLAYLAALAIAAASLGGILLPGAYAKETPSLAAQGIGQDWVNLLVCVPWFAVTASLAARGSARGTALLGGGFAYAAYSYAVYAFGVHFNALFLLYCAALGLSAFGLILALAVPAPDVAGRPRLAAAWTQIAIAVVFGLLWLGDIVPATLRGEPPRSVTQDNLVTNPVHVLDLSLALPALVVSGVSLLRRRPLGDRITPVMLSFALLMAVAIGGMVVAVWLKGLSADPTVAIVFAAVAAVCAAVLVAWLRSAKTQGARPVSGA